MMKRLEGVVGAALTAFTPAGGVDLAAIGAQFEFLGRHCDAVSVLGAGVSEFSAVSDDMRLELLRLARAVLGPEIGIVAGASGRTLEESKALIRSAAENGADFVQVLMPLRPWGGEPLPADTLEYMKRVADASPLPVIAYHNPKLGSDPPLDTIAAICSLDRVVAMKDSSRNIARCLSAVEAVQVRTSASYLTTLEPMLSVLIAGGAGVMTPAPFVPFAGQMRDAVAAGDMEGMRRAQRIISMLEGTWSQYGLLPMAKYLMRVLGIPVGAPLQPYSPIPHRFEESLRSIARDWY